MLQSQYGLLEIPPVLNKGASSLGVNNLTLDLAGEKCHLVGCLVLEGGSSSGPKTLSAAGSKIHWRSGTVTWSGAGSTVRIGIQEVSTVGSVAQGDGTFVVYKDLVTGTDGIAANSPQVTTMAIGSKSIAHGAKIAIAFEMTARGVSDSVIVTQYAPAIIPNGQHFPAVMLGAPTFIRQAVTPTAIIEFDDGTLGWLAPSCPILGGQGSINFHVNTATFDEYGNIFTPTVPMRAMGIIAVASPLNASANFDLSLYSNPLGTPVPIANIPVLAAQLGNPANFVGTNTFIFNNEVILEPGVSYGYSLAPTTTGGISMYYQDVSVAAHWRAISLNENCYAIKRLDNGIFSDYNDGTPKTRRLSIALIVDQINDRSGNAQFHLGI